VCVCVCIFRDLWSVVSAYVLLDIVIYTVGPDIHPLFSLFSIPIFSSIPFRIFLFLGRYRVVIIVALYTVVI
jgi:hypothetical protein